MTPIFTANYSNFYSNWDAEGEFTVCTVGFFHNYCVRSRTGDEPIEAKTVAEFFAAIPSGPLSGGILFRGQRDSSWKLVPGLFRGDLGYDIKRSDFRTIERLNLIDFFNLAEAHLEKPVLRNDLRDRIIAQHYGLRTSLLDWSKNPLIALFFACKDDTRDGQVFLVKTSNEITNDAAVITDDYLERAKLVEIVPPSLDARIIAQASRFTFQAYPKKGESFIPLDERFPVAEMFPPHKGVRQQPNVLLSSVLIPKGSKRALREQLNSFGVNELSVFPELQSVGRYITQKMTREISWTR